MSNELAFQYWFLQNEDISYGRKQRVIEYFYNSFNIYTASASELVNSGLFTETEAEKFVKNRSAFDLEKEYEKFCQSPFSFITMENPAYPEKLSNIYDRPYGLFYNGNLPDFNHCIAIVGARRCSAYGKKLAFELGNKLAKEGFTIISGMARGIDTHSHRGAIEAEGRTVAVLGSGCDVIYPPENHLIYEEIVQNGAVMSEYQMGSSPIAQNFPRRNRIVSALSDIVIVIEAREKSGSLITADLALDQGKDIYVVPGRIGDSLSEGCNRLISQGAGIIYNVDAFVNEILERYGMDKTKKIQKNQRVNISAQEKKILSLFDYYPKSLATIMEQTNIDYLNLLTVVYSLEKQGLIEEVFKNNYVKFS
ncbi:MAG: DNA-processing protein DprA [Pseudobutyrivibrio sp.]|nr:DNA-processing protein DprA [Pseudobutyrivibrio sp.]